MPRHSSSVITRARILSRIVGAIFGVVVGTFYAGFIITNSPEVFGPDKLVSGVVLAGSALVGAVALALAAPMLTVEPYLWLEGILDEAPPSEVVGAVAGVAVALLLAALVAVLLSPLPYGIGSIVSLTLAACLVAVGARTGTRRRQQFGALIRPAVGQAARSSSEAGPPAIDGFPVVVDTSALIDGRIVDVARAGFIPGRLLIAGFVLEELQRVADAGDPMRRARGRRGLAALEELRRRDDVVCEMVEMDFPDTPEVDTRLIKLAAVRSAMLLTSDYNLNRIASIAGVRVLNINDLANAMKPILSSGEQLSISIVREGKEAHQGVGYLDDGTMVVVENARDRLGDTVRATVTSVLQTSSGRMIFATTEGSAAAGTGQVRATRPRAAHR
jgi:uncharacterized protein YacL